MRKNVAGQKLYFRLMLAADNTAATGKTVTAKRSIDGAAQGSVTGSITEDGLGQYHLNASQADTNGNDIGFLFTAASCRPEHVHVATIGQLLDEDLTAHTTAGSVGKALTDAAVAIVPNTIAAAIWAALTSALTVPGSIGAYLLAAIDVTLSTRLAAVDYTAPANSSIAAIKTKTDNLPGSPAAVSDIPTANANADALLDRADGVETGWTFRQACRVVLAVLAGKVSGAATTTATIRDVTDVKNRVVATVDANGNRSAVTYDKT